MEIFQLNDSFLKCNGSVLLSDVCRSFGAEVRHLLSNQFITAQDKTGVDKNCTIGIRFAEIATQISLWVMT